METTDKRGRILEAAEMRFRNRRSYEITLEAVARSARVGKVTIGLYFKDTYHLFFQVTTSGFDDWCALAERHAVSKGRFLDRPLAICEDAFGFFGGRLEKFNIIQTEAAWIPGEQWSHRVLLEQFCNGTLEHDMPPRSPRGRTRDLACAL